MTRLMVGLSITLLAGVVNAGLITVAFAPDPNGNGNLNDCSGVFGQGFENCTVNGSPIIAKYEYDDGVLDPSTADDPNPTINSLFSSVQPGDFTINFGTTYTTGSWTYDQQGNDPNVRYWVAKGGTDGFNLFYMLTDADEASCGSLMLSGCMDLAIAQTSGRWITPNGQGLSHISFYDTGVSVPEPGSLALLGAGLLGLGLMRRKRT